MFSTSRVMATAITPSEKDSSRALLTLRLSPERARLLPRAHAHRLARGNRRGHALWLRASLLAQPDAFVEPAQWGWSPPVDRPKELHQRRDEEGANDRGIDQHGQRSA